MRAAPVAALLLLATACSESAFVLEPPPLLPPKVVATVVERWYLVNGRTVGAISEFLTHHALGWEREQAYALTTWRVAWSGRSTIHQGVCRLVGVRVNVEVIHMLPRWVDQEHATYRAMARWREFERALRAHEEGHRNIAYRAGIALLERLEGLQDPSCATLSVRVRAEATTLLARFRDHDRAYDRRTDRGCLQGVVW